MYHIRLMCVGLSGVLGLYIVGHLSPLSGLTL